MTGVGPVKASTKKEARLKSAFKGGLIAGGLFFGAALLAGESAGTSAAFGVGAFTAYSIVFLIIVIPIECVP